MTGYNPEQVLADIEDAIRKEPPTQPEPMQCDRWLLASLYQKAVRRGATAQAMQAAASLWHEDNRKLWVRLHIIAIEDCSADANIIIAVLTATAASTWRRRVGDLRVALHLTRLLCESVKSRAADELYLYAEKAGSLAPLRERFAVADDALLIDRVMNESSPLAEKTLSLWYLFGFKRYQSETMPKRDGSPEAAVKVLRSLNAPVELVESCIGVMNKTQYPLALFAPLIWQAVHRQGEQLKVRHNQIQTSSAVEGIPLAACDGYTRIGGACFRQLRRAVPELEGFTVGQIKIGIFYLEGGLLDKVLTSPFLEELCQAGEAADAEGAGMSPHQYQHLRECLVQNADLLDDIRRDKLHRYLSEAVV